MHELVSEGMKVLRRLSADEVEEKYGKIRSIIAPRPVPGDASGDPPAVGIIFVAFDVIEGAVLVSLTPSSCGDACMLCGEGRPAEWSLQRVCQLHQPSVRAICHQCPCSTVRDV